MMKFLRNLFLLVLLGSFVLAVQDKPPEIVLGGFAVGIVGLVAVSVLDSYLSHLRFYRAVERYANSRPIRYSAAQRMRKDFRIDMFMSMLFVIFVAGIALTIIATNPYFILITFLAIVFFGIRYMMGHVSEEKESWKDAALQLHLSFGFDSSRYLPRLSGAFRGREVSVVLKRVRRMSTSSGRTFSTVSGNFRTSSSTTKSQELTVVSTKVGAPGELYLSFRGGKHKSKPPELSSYVLQRRDIAERVRAISPFAWIEMKDALLFLQWDGVVEELAEIEFLLDLVCDIAEAVETFVRED